MANFRRSNVRNGRRSASSWLSRIIILFVLLVVAIFYLGSRLLDLPEEGGDEREDTNELNRHYLPESQNGQLVHHKYFSLSYREDWEQAEWVAYKLLAENLNKQRVKLNKRFRPDYDIKTRSSFHRDYTNSGYTRGHLAPAADMSFNAEAFEECYYMSNMSPQIRSFNNGIWRELEENIRLWAKKEKELIIITGPVVTNVSKKIGDNRVAIPTDFYKVILDIYGKEQKSIAFYIPHEKSESHLSKYALSIDELEVKLDLDLFPNLLDDWEEEQIESSYDISLWQIDQKKYQNRVKYWNNQ